MQGVEEVVSEIRQDVKEIKKEVAEVNKTLLRNTVSLEVHERRTKLAEDRIERIERWQLTILLAIAGAVISAAVKLLSN